MDGIRTITMKVTATFEDDPLKPRATQVPAHYTLYAAMQRESIPVSVLGSPSLKLETETDGEVRQLRLNDLIKELTGKTVSVKDGDADVCKLEINEY